MLSLPCRSCSCVVSCHVIIKLFYKQIKWWWWWCSFICLTSVPDPTPRVFFHCRTADNPVNHIFTINRCPCNQVIRIHSAEVGFSHQCQQNAECTTPVTNHSAIMRCNGLATCSINRDVLNSSPDDQQCGQHRKRNFIKITYTCNNGNNVCIIFPH